MITKMLKIIKFLVITNLMILVSCKNKNERADQFVTEYKFVEAVNLYKESVKEDNSAYAKWKLGLAYASGRGVEFDNYKAADLLAQAAKDGCEEAICDLGYAYVYGYYNIQPDVELGYSMLTKLWSSTTNDYCLVRYCRAMFSGDFINLDREKGIELLNHVKEKNSALYLRTLGDIVLDEDSEKALSYYKKAFDAGDFYSAYILGSIYKHGFYGIKESINLSVEWFNKGIKGYDTDCMMEMSKICLSNDSSYCKWFNIPKGIELLERAGNHGEGAAFSSLGNYYINGEIIPKNDERAFYYFNKAYELRDPVGTNNLGALYKDGIGCTKNLDKAIELYTLASDLGDYRACNNLYLYYYDKKEYPTAKKYLRLAADRDDIYGLYNIALHYYQGSELFDKDVFQAFRYFKRAAEMGNVDAIEYVAYMYQNGIGTDKNPNKAKEFKEKLTAKTY